MSWISALLSQRRAPLGGRSTSSVDLLEAADSVITSTPRQSRLPPLNTDLTAVDGALLNMQETT